MEHRWCDYLWHHQLVDGCMVRYGYGRYGNHYLYLWYRWLYVYSIYV